ncbi:MAG: hypothetical protein ACRCVW_00480, partial [Brevinema sp.]
MKRFMNFIMSSFLIIIFGSCSLASRESVKLDYQNQQIINTLDNGPFKSIKPDGSFDKENFDSWNFQKETMTLTHQKFVDGAITSTYVYSIEIVEDISVESGTIRVYGSGPLNNKFIGISALTNSVGAFVKFNIQDNDQNIIENARKKVQWEYAANPIIYRTHVLYGNKNLVTLTEEEFFQVTDYSYLKPVQEIGLDGKPRYLFKNVKVLNGVETPRDDLILKSLKLLPEGFDIYEIEVKGVNKYLGIQYSKEPNNSKMKILQGNSEEEVLRALNSLKYFNYQLETDAARPNRVIKATKNQILVKLRKTGGAAPGTGTYFWEGTEELSFNSKNMTLQVVNTFNPVNPTEPFGVTNIFNYTIKMVDDVSATSGIFTITGNGNYHGMYAALRVEERKNNTIFADFIVNATEAGAKAQLEALELAPTLNYQDIVTAEKPYRLIENLESIGKQWVALVPGDLGGMEFDSQNTEIYEFLDLTARTLKYTSIKEGIPSESYYKVDVAFDINDTRGIVQLIGYNGPTFDHVDTTKILHGIYISIERGSELYKTQAKYYKSYDLEDAKQGMSRIPLFNLHERSSVPSDYRVISQMEKFGPWVALVYAGGTPGEVADSVPNGSTPSYFVNDTDTWEFDLSLLLEVKITRTVAGVSATPAIYRIRSIQDISETYGIFQFQLFSGIDLGYDNMYFAIKTGKGSDASKGYIGIGSTEADAVAALNKINSPARLLHNYSAASVAPVSPNVIETISGIRYIEFNKDSSGNYNGTIIPYNTKIYTFDLNTLTFLVETYRPSQKDPSIESYTITMRLDEGYHAGVFQINGEGLPLNRQFGRLDV